MAIPTARDIMARSEATFSPEADIYDAVQQLLKNKLTGAAVVDGHGALVGGALDGLPSGQVKDYMISPVESVDTTTSVYDIVHRFLTGSFRKLPVVDDQGRVVGQVSRRDALIALASPRDNARLYGANDVQTPDGAGVDSAMRIARGRRS